MGKYRHLKKAPITEALIDLRVEPVEIQTAWKDEIAASLAADYPIVEEQRSINTRIGLASGGAETRDVGTTGYVFKTEDGNTLVQFRSDGFTFNKLEPYTSWDEILPASLRLWSHYVTRFQPSVVTRIAVRYINHIGLPSIGFVPEKYFESPVETPHGAPQMVSRYLQTMVLHDPGAGNIVRVTQALEMPGSSTEHTFLLDIDASRSGAFPTDEPIIEDALSSLRQLKNDVFFGHLTDEALRLFE